MKTASLFLLLAVLAYISWEAHVAHEQQEQKAAHELMEGYDRCVAPVDESLADSKMAPDWDRESPQGKDTLRIWKEARDGCRNFYFGGEKAQVTTSSAPSAQSSLVMYAPDGTLEEVPDSRAKFAAEAGYVAAMWFKPPGYMRAFPVPLNGTQMAMYNEGWIPLNHPLTAAEARAQYWIVRPPRGN